MTETLCNLCGCREFTDINTRASMRCADCGSLERTRLLFLHVQRLALPPEARVLHIAPERGLYRYFKARQKPGHYVPADIAPQNYRFAGDCVRIDLCNLAEWPAARFDLILHSHVLEHCAAPLADIFANLHRMLTPGGLHMFIVPFAPGHWDECLTPLSDAERIARFDQADHVRRFGIDALDQHLGALVALPETYDAMQLFDSADLIRFNIPKYLWKGLSGASVITLEKNDLIRPST